MSLLYRMGTGNGSGGDLKPFIVEFTCSSGFIGKTVTMEFQGTPHAGEVVENVSGTVVLDGTDGKGKLTLYPMHDGLWKYYATSDVVGYKEGTITLEKWGNYPVELKDIPKGATFTPTDDVQTWLHCADVFNKSYTTISEVVADTTTLNILISDNNASDYLARSTTWASDVCSNESAMTYIGLNDYCANKLLADSTWCTAICNAKDSSGKDLFEKVLNVKVPTLSEPDSNVLYSSEMDDNYRAWKAFDDNVNTRWVSQVTDNTPNIGYNFTKKVKVFKCMYAGSGNGYMPKDVEILGVNDDNSTDVLHSFTVTDLTTKNQHYENIASTSKSYNSFKFYSKTIYKDNIGITKIQFYGREA